MIPCQEKKDMSRSPSMSLVLVMILRFLHWPSIKRMLILRRECSNVCKYACEDVCIHVELITGLMAKKRLWILQWWWHNLSSPPIHNTLSSLYLHSLSLSLTHTLEHTIGFLLYIIHKTETFWNLQVFDCSQEQWPFVSIVEKTFLRWTQKLCRKLRRPCTWALPTRIWLIPTAW